MIIAIIKETKIGERRVAISPTITKKLSEFGIRVKIEKEAGLNAGYDDQQYLQAGAEIFDTAKTCLEKADFLFKINAPRENEWQLISENTFFKQLRNTINNFNK